MDPALTPSGLASRLAYQAAWMVCRLGDRAPSRAAGRKQSCGEAPAPLSSYAAIGSATHGTGLSAANGTKTCA